MSKSKTKTATQEQSTVQGTTPGWITNALRNQQGRIDDFANTDPSQYVAPSSPLQNAAFSLAGGLAQRMGYARQAPAGATNLNTSTTGVMPAPGAGAPQPIDGGAPKQTGAGYSTPKPMSPGMGGQPQGGVTTPPANSSAPAASSGMGANWGDNIDPSTLTSPDPNMLFGGAGLLAGIAGTRGPNTVDQVATANVSGPAAASGYDASSPAAANGYDASGRAGVRNVNATTGQANTVDMNNLPRMQSGQIDTAEIQRLMNPYMSDVYGASMSDFDQNAGQVRAQQAAQAAGSGAFGGSRYGVREGQTEGELARARGSLGAGILSDGYNTALGYASGQADRNQATNANNFALQGQSTLANQNAENTFGLQNMAAMNAAASQNADAYNRSSLDFAGRTDAAGAFGADAGNRSALDFAGRNDAAGQFGADAQNRSALDFAGRADANGQFNANTVNNMGQFNAGQQDQNIQQMLQSAGLLGNLGQTIGSEDRSNIGLLAALGGEQRGIDSAYRNATPTQIQLLAQLQGQQQYGLYSGQNSNSSGTSTTTNTPSMLDSLGRVVGIGQQVAGFKFG